MKMILLIATLVASLNASCAAQPTWRSRQSGLWTDTATWQYFTGNSWRDTSVSPSTVASVLIDSSHVVTLNASVKIRNLTLHSASPSGKLIFQQEKTLTVSGQLSCTSPAPPSSLFSPANGSAGSILFTGEDSTQIFGDTWGSSPNVPHLVIRLTDSSKIVATASSQNIKTNFFELVQGKFFVDGDLRIDGGADSTTGKAVIASGATLTVSGKMKRSTTNLSSFDSLTVQGYLIMESTSGTINAQHIILRKQGSITTPNSSGLTNLSAAVIKAEPGSTIRFNSSSSQIIPGAAYSNLILEGGTKTSTSLSADKLWLNSALVADTVFVRTHVFTSVGSVDGVLERNLFTEPFVRFEVGKEKIVRPITIFKTRGTATRASAWIDSAVHLPFTPADGKQSKYYYGVAPNVPDLLAKVFLTYSLSDFPAGTVRSDISAFIHVDTGWKKLSTTVNDSVVTIDTLSAFGPIILSAVNTLTVHETIQHEQIDIQVFPNPFSNSFIVRSERSVVAQLVDLLGNIVIKNIEVNKRCNASHLSPGIYFLRYQSGGRSGCIPVLHVDFTS